MFSFKLSVVRFNISLCIIIDFNFIFNIYIGILKHAMFLMLTVNPVESKIQCIKKMIVDQTFVTLQGNLCLKQFSEILYAEK